MFPVDIWCAVKKLDFHFVLVVISFYIMTYVHVENTHFRRITVNFLVYLHNIVLFTSFVLLEVQYWIISSSD